MNEERTVRYTRETLPPDAQTDWARVDAMTEQEIEASAAADLDNPPWTEEQLAAAELVMPGGGTKVPISIRLDEEVVEFFRSQGAGYQSRINAVLLGYVRRRRSRSP